MSLVDEAIRAVEIADAFSKFRDPVEEETADITATIAELNALSVVLRKIDALLHASDEATISALQADLNLAHSSIAFTLEDIWSILGRIGNGAPVLTSSAYRKTWREIRFKFGTSGRQNLVIRLELYRRFLLELCSILRRRSPSVRLIEDLRGDIRGLLDSQDRPMITATEAPDTLAVDTSVLIPRTRSYERERDRERSRPPISPTNSRDSYGRDAFPAIPVPDVPNSPTGTFSTTSWTSSMDTETSHWAREVFRDATTLSSTPFPTTTDVSQCYGESMRFAKEHLDHKYEELFKINFGEMMCLRLYHRERDHRARVLCETPERSGHCWYSALPLNALECHRDETALHLCQPRPGRPPLAWATIYFTTVERMVLFFCTFLSLRSHDSGKPYTNIRDYTLRDEDEFFGGQIRDDGYIHALRVCRDRHSKAIRLQASVWLGDMKNTPVWTAFITHSIFSPTWQRRADHKTVCLRELRRHVFSPRYEAPISVKGEHILEFTSEDDATGFMRTIVDLAGTYRRV